MKLALYQIDAFSGELFGGNPAAVCPLDDWLDDDLLQAIAAENNLSETAFVVRHGQGYGIRWFTPACEVDLCGHATLASAAVIHWFLEPGRERVEFESRSGVLRVDIASPWLTLDFPAADLEVAEIDQALIEGLGARPRSLWRAGYDMAVFDTQSDVLALDPSMPALERLDALGVVATAPGEEVDFVSRFFAPKAGIPEDPVTGSAHCMLVPYWERQLGKRHLEARQLSQRGGLLRCEAAGERVKIGGQATLYLIGTIELP